MKYDFDEIVPRRGTNAIKWDMDTDPEVLSRYTSGLSAAWHPLLWIEVKKWL